MWNNLDIFVYVSLNDCTLIVSQCLYAYHCGILFFFFTFLSEYAQSIFEFTLNKQYKMYQSYLLCFSHIHPMKSKWEKDYICIFINIYLWQFCIYKNSPYAIISWRSRMNSKNMFCTTASIIQSINDQVFLRIPFVYKNIAIFGKFQSHNRFLC